MPRIQRSPLPSSGLVGCRQGLSAHGGTLGLTLHLRNLVTEHLECSCGRLIPNTPLRRPGEALFEVRS